MAASEWERFTQARAGQRFKIAARHIIRRPLLIIGLISVLVLFNLLKDTLPLAYGLAAPAMTVLVMASMGRYRRPPEDTTPEDASLPADTDGK
ncbi:MULTISPECIES: hypothetical protein [Streptomyces]|uniref:DUF3099 domain-containing protein n=1 Tax=Streptomyces glycanivorans TaxID=3033808 RepID=A0ABY9J2X8_9ACTN|nr:MULTISPECIES: hypothetical protein [unclassified Streptomyces]WSQ75600.1 hypothetical protein OG725_00230 [Streptomyces sp. NBC_01213]TXS12597.1 hypothetical protein EAO68_22660 [Streptomyces sp. wa22]WLQ62091.1 hypothetical protein P8A20_00120 [Streptomyces sp. Alt3]WSR04525.1 hypothetical protein OG265_00150 [Streptomyces sp. NBC_01208]WSR52825.1 hypothetical protein OG279_36710 [Streptomyces sp. NBC_01201]